MKVTVERIVLRPGKGTLYRVGSDTTPQVYVSASLWGALKRIRQIFKEEK